MKKILTILLATVFILMAPAIAQEEPVLADPGTTPDSPLYLLDLAVENIGLALQANTDDRIETELRIAEERLSEAREMALEGNLEAMSIAEDEHETILNRIETDITEISDPNVEEELRKELEIEQKINEHKQKVVEVQNELKLKIKIKGEITPEQQALLDSILASLEGQTGEVEIEINNEKGKTKIKIEQEIGRSGDEVEDELQQELEIEDNNEIKVKIEDGVAKVEIEINDTKDEFVSNSTDQEEIIAEIADRLGVSVEEIIDIVEFEIDEEDNNNVNDTEDNDNESDDENKEDEDNNVNDTEDNDNESDDENKINDNES